MSDRQYPPASAVTALRTGDQSRTRAVALLGMLFGLLLIYGVGFAHPEAIHNAAHDSRHSFAFPCH